MHKGAYEIIKLLIKSVDQSVRIDFKDGTSRTIPIDPEKLLAELDQLLLDNSSMKMDLFAVRQHAVRMASANMDLLAEINQLENAADWLAETLASDYRGLDTSCCRCGVEEEYQGMACMWRSKEAWRNAARNAVKEERNA